MWPWLHRHLFRNLGTKLVALVLALTLYAHVFASREREVVFDVPFYLQGLPEDLVWSGEVPEMARVRCRGLGLELIKLHLDTEGPRLTPQVGDVQPGRYYRPVVSEDVTLPSHINVQVIEVVTPRAITLEFDRLLERQLLVIPTVAGRPAPGFITLGRVTAVPGSVLVRGPEKRLSAFEFLKTEAVDIADAEEVITRVALLRLPSQCTADPAEVEVTVTIEKVISRTFLDLSVEVLRSSGMGLGRMTPESGSVVVSGPRSVVESLTPDELRLSIDALGLPRGTYTLMASVEVSRALEAGAVSVEPVEPEKVEVVLE